VALAIGPVVKETLAGQFGQDLFQHGERKAERNAAGLIGEANFVPGRDDELVRGDDVDDLGTECRSLTSGVAR
jgi:hypothetical protein